MTFEDSKPSKIKILIPVDSFVIHALTKNGKNVVWKHWEKVSKETMKVVNELGYVD